MAQFVGDLRGKSALMIFGHHARVCKGKQVNRIIDFLQSFDMQIKCAGDNTEQMINILDIYYIESVDKKTFVYLENTVFFVAFNSLQHNKSTRRNLKISKKTDNISCFSIDSFL